MSRGFKVAIAETNLAYDEGRLIDVKRRSFISQPKVIVGECDTPQPHLLLYGDDKGPIRAEIFRRNREANNGVNRCWKCWRLLHESEDERLFDGRYPVGEWHHVRNKPGERCDDPENGAVSCPDCHRDEHVQVQFGVPALAHTRETPTDS